VLVFGPKAAGKSTTLAWLAEHLGLTIISDDLAVVVDGAVLAGPRSIDLRIVEPIAPIQRLQILGAQRTFSGLTENPVSLLEIASKPMVRIARPRDPATVAAAARALVDHFA
jgi:hypothetical protein